MESLDDLKRWDDYRDWMRKQVKRVSAEPEVFYISRVKLDFQINGKAWKGNAVLLGRKSRMLAQKMRQEGCLFLEGTASAQGKILTLNGFLEKHVIGTERLFRKLKLGYAIEAGLAADGAADPLEQQWKARKARTFATVEALLKSERPDLAELKATVRQMAAAEREQDWARALSLLNSLLGFANGAPPVTVEENARLAALSPEALARTDLTRGDPKELFSEDYMEQLMDAPIKGVGDPSLKALMREVEKGLSGARRGEVMEALARIVGIPPTAAKLNVDYGRFLVVRKQQAVNAKRKDEKIDALNEEMHPKFMASRGQLMFGKVLGDAFGIHAIFAALLSPTGGLVGPGNWLIPGIVQAGHLDPDNPVALHGTVHDAAGYLLTFHGEGPGYNYRDSMFEILGTESPLSGQISGIAYWVREAGDEYLLHRVQAAVVAVEKKLKSARDAVAGSIDALLSKVRRTKKEAVETVSEVVDEVEETFEDVADAIEEARDKVERAAVDTFETAADTLGEIGDQAKRKLEAAWDFVWS
ncbi:MAG: hypothetical protein AAGC57_07805 [Pseudomonadota bacterium]